MTKSKKEYEDHLNNLYSIYDCLKNTEHCWAGNDKTFAQKKGARLLAEAGHYGTVLKKYDPIAFNVGYNEWRREIEK